MTNIRTESFMAIPSWNPTDDLRIIPLIGDMLTAIDPSALTHHGSLSVKLQFE